MNHFDGLKSLCNSLSESEYKSILNDLRNSSYSNNLSVQLFEILYLDPSEKFDEVSLKIYKTKNYEALKKLTQRLLERLLENMITKEMIDESGLFDGRSLEVINVRRRMLQHDILIRHNVANYAQILLESIINKCKEIEYYDYLIMALEKKMTKISLANGTKEYKTVFKDIERYSDCNISLKRAKYLMRYYFTNTRYNQKLFLESELLNVIGRVETDMKRTKSSSITFYYFIMKGILHSNQFDNIKCLKSFLDLESFIKSNKTTFSYGELMTCWLNIANCYLLVFDFNASLKYLSLLKKRGLVLTFNFKMLLEIEFLNYYYSGEFEKCKVVLPDLIEVSKTFNISSFLIERRLFYMASYEFVIRNYVDVVKILNNCKTLDKDKDGWNLGVRLLLILANIELGRLSIVENLIENLRKHIARVSNLGLSRRFTSITKLLIALERNSFDFKITASKNQKELDKLSSFDVKYRVELSSPEMIIFHEWFLSKVNNLEYNHKEAIQRLKMVHKQK